MLLVVIAWLYVVLMVAVAEATSSQGTLVSAVFTFLLYAVLPLSILTYLFFSPARRRAAKARAVAAEDAEASSGTIGIEPNGGDHAAGDPVATVRKEP
jgi:hypothetical protein